jgi:raffinose/stachyose/melibiose transport system substrate-binding protein
MQRGVKSMNKRLSSLTSKRLKVTSFLLLAFMLVLTACGGGNNSNNSSPSTSPSESAVASPEAPPAEKVVLKIPHYKAGTNVGAKFFLPQIERFNQKYEGKYEIQVEEVPDDKYVDKIKLLYQQNMLPALIEAGDQTVIDELIKKDGIVDLTPMIDSNPDMKKLFIKESVDYNLKEGNGKIYSLPRIITNPIGIFYNKELFAKAGITKPISQMTWDEFDQALQQLKDNNITPLSTMTGENGWTTMLLGSGYMASLPGSADILKSETALYDFTGEQWVKTFAEIQKWLKDYSLPTSIGATYADAANAFLNEKAAMIANGPWMAGDFLDTTKAPAGFDKKVGYSLMPGGEGFDNLVGFSWWIPKGLPKGEEEAALAFLQFISSPDEVYASMAFGGGFAPNLPSSDEVNAQVNPILGEFNKTAQSDLKLLSRTLQDVWPNQITQTEFGRYSSLLAKEKLTPEKFAEELTKKAQQFKPK